MPDACSSEIFSILSCYKKLCKDKSCFLKACLQSLDDVQFLIFFFSLLMSVNSQFLASILNLVLNVSKFYLGCCIAFPNTYTSYCAFSLGLSSCMYLFSSQMQQQVLESRVTTNVHCRNIIVESLHQFGLTRSKRVWFTFCIEHWKWVCGNRHVIVLYVLLVSVGYCHFVSALRFQSLSQVWCSIEPSKRHGHAWCRVELTFTFTELLFA